MSPRLKTVPTGWGRTKISLKIHRQVFSRVRRTSLLARRCAPAAVSRARLASPACANASGATGMNPPFANIAKRFRPSPSPINGSPGSLRFSTTTAINSAFDPNKRRARGPHKLSLLGSGKQMVNICKARARMAIHPYRKGTSANRLSRPPRNRATTSDKSTATNRITAATRRHPTDYVNSLGSAAATRSAVGYRRTASNNECGNRQNDIHDGEVSFSHDDNLLSTFSWPILGVSISEGAHETLTARRQTPTKKGAPRWARLRQQVAKREYFRAEREVIRQNG